MSWSNMSGCVRKTGKREMLTSTLAEMDLNSKLLGLGRSSVTTATRSSNSSRERFRLGLAEGEGGDMATRKRTTIQCCII